MIDKNITIVGGSGFLGTRLAKILRFNNIKTSILDTNSDADIQFNIENFQHHEIPIDTGCIINLAAIHRDDIYPISRYDDVNVQGSRNICDAARKLNINKIIFTSSVAIYGFAPANTDEKGQPNYFNDYGRTKYLAEQVYKEWQKEDPENRVLVIVRPTVIFGEGNRGNVYNLLNQIALKRFVMFGNGRNIKSMAYVENVAGFLCHCLSFKPGVHIYNYIDKPDMDMNSLVTFVRKILFNKNNVGIRLPASLATIIGYFADSFSKITNIKLPISSIRVKKFMSNSQFNSSFEKTGFKPSVGIEEALARTLKYEFIDDNKDKKIFETE
ncbi:NAD(P)-dependent oxidoreductase [Gammaproteobacteria bacterium]|nr:NAD(P)-dependent oxidoreductase [Gammaproteobacteria bacterium]